MVFMLAFIFKKIEIKQLICGFVEKLKIQSTEILVPFNEGESMKWFILLVSYALPLA